MKKIILLLAAVLLLLTGCAGKKSEVLSGRITHIYGANVLIAADSGELCYAQIGTADTAGEKLMTGQIAEFRYARKNETTYPTELCELQSVSLTGSFRNTVDAYLKITAEMIAQAEEAPELIVYDFSAMEGYLSAAEQLSVAYVGWTELDIEGTCATAEELREQGKLEIKGKKESLPGGCILSFAPAETEEGGEELLKITLWQDSDTVHEALYRLYEENGTLTAIAEE